MLVGCLIAPVPVRTRARTGPGGEERALDLKFLRIGTTTKNEVLEKIGWMETWIGGCKHERIFWGRWQGSSWAIGGLYGAPPAPVMLPGGERKWSWRNLLLEFDEKGIVQRFATMPDKRVKTTLEAWLKDANEPVSLSSNCP